MYLLNSPIVKHRHIMQFIFNDFIELNDVKNIGFYDLIGRYWRHDALTLPRWEQKIFL